MYHISQATSQAIGSIRQGGHADASVNGDEPAAIGNPRHVDQSSTTSDRPRTPFVPDTPGSPVPSRGEYSSASDWVKRKKFSSSGRQRSDPYISQRRSSTTAPYPSPTAQRAFSPENVDDWYSRYIEEPSQRTTPRRIRDNTLRHLEYHSPPAVFRIYSRGQPGISIQMLLSKWSFDRGDTRLGQIINFQLVNPPIRFKFPDGTFAQHTVGDIKISETMTICEFCMKIAGKMGIPADGLNIKDLTILSLELAQNSVTCSLDVTHSTSTAI